MLPNVGVPVTFAYGTFDIPPPSAVTRPVVVIVLEPNAFNKVTTLLSPYVDSASAANVPSPLRTLETLPSILIVEILPSVGVPVTLA